MSAPPSSIASSTCATPPVNKTRVKTADMANSRNTPTVKTAVRAPTPATEPKEKPKQSIKPIQQEFIPYPEVRSPTATEKKRREQELEEEKKRKIAEGFYQPRSDEDDTLEKVVSLNVEASETTKKRSVVLRNSSKRKKPAMTQKKAESIKEYTARE